MDMEDKKLDRLLKSALSTNYVPDQELNKKILQSAKERENMNIKRFRRFPVVVAACLLLICSSVTVFATWKYLAPKDVAIEYGNPQLAKAFESDDAITVNETQSYGEYNVTVLGVVSGSNLSEFCSNGDNVRYDRTYAVVAISKKDGTPMPKPSDDEYGKEPFFISPLIQGLNPNKYNIVTMNGGYYDIVKDGILYRLSECDNVELFADREIYLCVGNSTFFDRNAYVFNEETGKITPNGNYKGMNLLFKLPLDAKNADKEAAQKYLDELELSWGESAHAEDIVEKVKDETVAEENAKLVELDVNEIIKNWKLVSEQKVKPDKEGRIYYSYKNKNSSMDGYVLEDGLFKEGEVGYSKSYSGGEGDNTNYSFVYYRDENGEITVYVYELAK